jgi:hypothetical protein
VEKQARREQLGTQVRQYFNSIKKFRAIQNFLAILGVASHWEAGIGIPLSLNAKRIRATSALWRGSFRGLFFSFQTSRLLSCFFSSSFIVWGAHAKSRLDLTLHLGFVVTGLLSLLADRQFVYGKGKLCQVKGESKLKLVEKE